MAQANRGKPPTNTTSQDWMDLDVPSRLPIIPLVSSVLFPGGVLSLQVGIDRNVRLLKPEQRPPVATSLGLRITFAEPVRGPIALGYASHFGLGAMAPVP